MAQIRIDGKIYEVVPGGNLLETCLALGLDIPHFCFHPALGSVGACRLCAVKKFKDADDQHGRIVMSCLEPVVDGLIVSVEDPEARAFRAAVLEGLMVNHPHDCPVCDEGGECQLQDMTVMTGHNYRKYDFRKRTHHNQDLGPFIHHEMNRCIQCYRCVRFYTDYAGGSDLNVFSAHDHVYFGRFGDGPLESVFSGNLVEVCPTGVFTDKTLKRHFTRKWDLTNAPSVCVHCSVGCNIITSERYDSLRRVMNRYNGAVNGYFLCDRGRFGYEFVNSERRVRDIAIRPTGNAQAVTPGRDEILKAFMDGRNPERGMIGIGSPRASLEANYALAKLVGEKNFYHGLSDREYRLTKRALDYLLDGGVRTPSLKQIEKADCVLVIGEDLTHTAPMMAMAVRQAVRNLPNELAVKAGIPVWNDTPVRVHAQDARSPLYLVSAFGDPLDGIARDTFRGSYPEMAGFAQSIAGVISGQAPVAGFRPELAEEIARSLKEAKNPLIVTGVTSGDEGILQSAFAVASALKRTGVPAAIGLVFPESNSLGLAMMPGEPLGKAVGRIAEEGTGTLVILENDLFRRASVEALEPVFEKSDQVIVLDHLENETTRRADILLPAATFAESEGTLVNQEGRAQRFYRAMDGKGQVGESWKWLDWLAMADGNTGRLRWNNLDAVISDLSSDWPRFDRLKNYAPDAGFRMLNAKVPRQTLRYSGRTAMHSHLAVKEPALQQDEDSPLAFSMEGEPENPPSSLVPFYWKPGWNSVQALYYYQNEPNGSLLGGDPGIRLIEPAEKAADGEPASPPLTTGQPEGDWTILPVYRIFGSEELSSAGPAIAQRIPEPFACVNPEEADRLGVKEGESVGLEVSGRKLNVRIRIENDLRSGIAGLSVQLPGMPYLDLPGRGKLNKL